ncbi:hypothetical protein AHiyo8_pI69880 (plasmid) [Arthrobacter sp. Hiyo8]|nr:hypothetical protein AHiyo8_pI69880 [Arthrobacter sp. Hiyo8]
MFRTGFGVRAVAPSAGIAGGLRGPWVILREGLARAARLGGPPWPPKPLPRVPGSGTALGAVDFGVGVAEAGPTSSTSSSITVRFSPSLVSYERTSAGLRR